MKTPNIDFKLSPKQMAFCKLESVDEVGYGGAAGGGKTFVQCVDALMYAIKYAGSKQLIIRKTFPELEKNVIRQALAIYPQKPFAKYNASKHLWTFANGSIIEYGYLAREDQIYLYLGTEWDVIRIDEATMIPWNSISFLRSRLRGSTPLPRSMKFSTNPGGVGHMWFKNRFVSPAPPFNIFTGADKTKRIYLPSSVYDNKALMTNDPDYVKRLEALSDPVQREMYLNGNWDIAAGAFFNEFDRRFHVKDPFDLMKLKDIKLYRSIDYGLDMLACLWYAELPPSLVNPHGKVFVYRECFEKDLTISAAAKKIRELTPPGENIICTYAPPDVLNNRDRVTGRNQGDMFSSEGLPLVRSNNDRKAGLIAIKELLSVRETGEPILEFFSTCTRMIKELPMQIHDTKNYGDVCKEPHEISHGVDSLRYYAIRFRDTHPIREIEDENTVDYGDEMLKDYRRASPAQRLEIERMMGGKPKFKTIF